jgi:hypothetical protein
MCRSVGFGAFFAAVIAMADCSRKAMSKNRPDRGTAAAICSASSDRSTGVRSGGLSVASIFLLLLNPFKSNNLAVQELAPGRTQSDCRVHHTDKVLARADERFIEIAG